jgi:hypothetical protein
MMRTLAQHFSRALSAGLKNEAKVAVNAIKSKAGDPQGGDDGNQW